ncbi:hypothetical protein UA08_09289 [Talaromyces atroroseus]|uniref:Uncharacterized protein n=1 Tax=Talaromyces atroroseus TaxID=1441469 RepID=A0A1Q5Q6D6_TALAT|nr:hypothetical protein UA08_09289 [Talaromyces atroroseus]OKL55404.1 hypothetical protein UA08_09289 [Talaromyces atroroseus]
MALAFDKIVLFGDSITQLAYDPACGFCFGAAMQHAYCRKLDVIQRGFGGYNSDHAVTIIDHLIQQETTMQSAIKLMAGLSFGFWIWFPILGRSDLMTFVARLFSSARTTLSRLIARVEQSGAKVVLVGPGPFNHHQFVAANGKEFFCDRTTIRARAYCDAAIEVGKERKVPTVPLWYLIMEELGWKDGDPIYGLEELSAENPLNEYLSDDGRPGVHYLGKAYKVEFTNVIKAIKDFYPELDPDRLSEKLPAWDVITSLDMLYEATA